jgi:beta-galactosidase/beta-glucuronidase
MSNGLTIWGETLDHSLPLNEYPRPQLMRRDWLNLNGQWQYEICPEGEIPKSFSGTITVPFTPEALLSGADRGIRRGEKLWYRRSFTLPRGFVKDRVLLNFGAVDQCCEVYINSRLAGSHEGGYIPFTFDITALLKSGVNEIMVGVTDAGSAGPHAYGKQSDTPGGIWYTGQCGIWQTVWLESVPERYIERLRLIPDFDGSAISIEAVGGAGAWYAVMCEGKRVAVGELDFQGKARIPLPDFIPWSPEQPFLYDLLIKLGDDVVKSYFAMRKVSVSGGRVALNNKPIFLTGLLDQGYWSDGLYTAPSDEAMIFDIESAKSLGYNMLRKHVKIEPLRWYYHCDRLGMLVWQDFPNGGEPYSRFWTQLLPLIFGIQVNDSNYARFGRSYEKGRIQYEKDMAEIVELLMNSPSVICWVPFNEGWGQFDSIKIERKLRALDPSRLIDLASGWHDCGGGNFKSRHVYFKKVRLKRDKHRRVLALTECGGYAFREDGQAFNDSDFGYKRCRTREDYIRAIDCLYKQQIIPNVREGLAVVIYTQLSDVEGELNGLFTFDRRVFKADADRICELNARLKES